VLRAKERASTFSPSNVFTFGLVVESIKEFEGASRVVCNFQIIDYNACYNKCSSLKEMQVVVNFQVQIK
jgi:hypothetical protein